MKRALVAIGILIQLYLVFTLAYSELKTDEFPEYQSLFYSFWKFFDTSYSALLFVFIISILIISVSIYSLAKETDKRWKWLLIGECIFAGYLSLGLI